MSLFWKAQYMYACVSLCHLMAAHPSLHGLTDVPSRNFLVKTYVSILLDNFNVCWEILDQNKNKNNTIEKGWHTLASSTHRLWEQWPPGTWGRAEANLAAVLPHRTELATLCGGLPFLLWSVLSPYAGAAASWVWWLCAHCSGCNRWDTCPPSSGHPGEEWVREASVRRWRKSNSSSSTVIKTTVSRKEEQSKQDREEKWAERRGKVKRKRKKGPIWQRQK